MNNTLRLINLKTILAVLKKGLFGLILFITIILHFTCRNNPFGPEDGFLHFTAEDIGITDLWLRVKVTPGGEPRRLILARDGHTILDADYFALDTLIFSDSLLPRHTYRFSATLTGKSIFSNSMTEFSVTTLDTTTHDFTWKIDTLGDGANSSLHDVVIVNDTLVYAVGELYLRDSTGQFDTTPYSVAKWNGKSWELKKLYYRMPAGDTLVLPNIRGILYLSASEIWFAAGSIFRWDGVSSFAELSFSRLNLQDPYGTIEKLWGDSRSHLYGVGNVGSIVRYSNGIWEQMPSGTDVDLLDVWGSPSGSVVWTCGYYRNKIGTFLLRYEGINWDVAYDGSATEFKILPDTLSGAFTGVYAVNEKKVYVGSSTGIYVSPASTQGEGRRVSFTQDYFPGFPNGLGGTASNDIFIVGDYNFIAHYNGINMQYMSQHRDQNGVLLSVAQRNNFVVTVGYSYDPINGRGVVFRGVR